MRKKEASLTAILKIDCLRCFLNGFRKVNGVKVFENIDF